MTRSSKSLPWFPPPEVHLLPMEQWRKAMLPEFNYLCSRLSNWQHCRLPPCRRARACRGNNDLNRRDSRFPPCVFDNDQQTRLIEETRRYEDELQEAYHCFED